VLLGVPGKGLADGARRRTEDSVTLLSWGFRGFSTVALDAPSLPAVRVWKGSAGGVAVQPAEPVRLTLRQDERDDLTFMVLARTPLVAPVYKGQQVGDLVYLAGTEEVGRIPLLADKDVAGAGPVRWAWDSLLLGVTTVAQDGAAVLQSALAALHPAAVVSSSAGAGAAEDRKTP